VPVSVSACDSPRGEPGTGAGTRGKSSPIKSHFLKSKGYFEGYPSETCSGDPVGSRNNRKPGRLLILLPGMCIVLFLERVLMPEVPDHDTEDVHTNGICHHHRDIDPHDDGNGCIERPDREEHEHHME